MKIQHRIYCHYCRKSLFWHFFFILFDNHTDSPFKTQKGRRCPFCSEMNRVPIGFRRECYFIFIAILAPAIFLASKFQGNQNAIIIILYSGFLLCCLVYIVLLFTRVRIEPVLLDVNDFDHGDELDDLSTGTKEPIFPGAVSAAVNKNWNQGVIRPLWLAFATLYFILSFAVLIGYFFEHVSIFNILPQILLRSSLTIAAYLYARGLIFLNPKIQQRSLLILLVALILVVHDSIIMLTISQKIDFLLGCLLPLFSLPGLYPLMRVIPKPVAKIIDNSVLIETLKKLIIDKTAVVDLYQQLYSASFLVPVRKGSEGSTESMMFLIYPSERDSSELPIFTSNDYINQFFKIYPNNDSVLERVPGALLWPRLLQIVLEKREFVAIDPGQKHGIRLNRDMILGMVAKYGDSHPKGDRH